MDFMRFSSCFAECCSIFSLCRLWLVFLVLFCGCCAVECFYVCLLCVVYVCGCCVKFSKTYRKTKLVFEILVDTVTIYFMRRINLYKQNRADSRLKKVFWPKLSVLWLSDFLFGQLLCIWNGLD